MRNRFKGLDLIDRVPDELWTEVQDTVKETSIKTIPSEKNCKKTNNTPVYEPAKETMMYRRVLWTLWERERVGKFGRMALKHVKYHV